MASVATIVVMFGANSLVGHPSGDDHAGVVGPVAESGRSDILLSSSLLFKFFSSMWYGLFLEERDDGCQLMCGGGRLTGGNGIGERERGKTRMWEKKTERQQSARTKTTTGTGKRDTARFRFSDNPKTGKSDDWDGMDERTSVIGDRQSGQICVSSPDRGMERRSDGGECAARAGRSNVNWHLTSPPRSLTITARSIWHSHLHSELSPMI